jgi:hypothetical protein
VVTLAAVLFVVMGVAWLNGSRVPDGTPRSVARLLGVVFLVLGLSLAVVAVVSGA